MTAAVVSSLPPAPAFGAESLWNPELWEMPK